MTWPFYWELHRFLGKLPKNDSTLVVDSLQCSISQVFIFAHERERVGNGYILFVLTQQDLCSPSPPEESATLGDVENFAPNVLQQNKMKQEVASSLNIEGNASTNAGQKKQKRKASEQVDLLREVIAEQRALRLSFEAGKKAELELQSTHSGVWFAKFENQANRNEGRVSHHFY